MKWKIRARRRRMLRAIRWGGRGKGKPEERLGSHQFCGLEECVCKALSRDKSIFWGKKRGKRKEGNYKLTRETSTTLPCQAADPRARC